MQRTAPPHLRAVDPALLKGALLWVAGTHMAVLTEVAGVRTANTGHKPGEGSGFRNNREGYTTLFSPSHKMHRGTNEEDRQNLRKSHSAHQDWTDVGTNSSRKS